MKKFMLKMKRELLIMHIGMNLHGRVKMLNLFQNLTLEEVQKK